MESGYALAVDVAIEGLGRRLRALRKARRMTLEQLAVDTGFTAGYLSQIETGASVPALSALAELAASLGADLTAFFPREEVSKVRVHRAGDPQTLRMASDPSTEFVAVAGRGFDGTFSALIARYAPGAKPPHHRHFGERFVFARGGQGILEIGGDRHELAPGRYVHYSSHLEHTIVPTSKDPLETLWLVIPPII